MRIFALAILLLLPLMSGCSACLYMNHCDREAERIYEKDNTFQLKAGIYYEAEKTNHALDVFEEMWSETWGNAEDANHMVNNMCIEWEPYPFEVEGLPETNEGLPGRASGLTESIDTVRVAILEPRKLSSTAFIHELVHVMLWRVNNEPDPDHEGDLYEGWTVEHNLFIRDVKLRLREELGEIDDESN